MVDRDDVKLARELADHFITRALKMHYNLDPQFPRHKYIGIECEIERFAEVARLLHQYVIGEPT